MKFVVERNWIEVVGGIWMPFGALCAQKRDLANRDIEAIGDPTRENVENWISINFGDFSSIKDFHAIIGETELAWGCEESEMLFNDCMFPQEETKCRNT